MPEGLFVARHLDGCFRWAPAIVSGADIVLEVSNGRVSDVVDVLFYSTSSEGST